ncbi:MAG: hypothetical protein HYS25_06300 [Ignavibacteriales bacterium]|nr:hypothetical protein [Ignavibacteriales bacterium]
MKKIKNIAIIFGKKEKTNFNRYTFPILNRPVVMYPILAAKHTSLIQQTYLSTDSQSLLSLCREIEGLKILTRDLPGLTLTEEIKAALEKVKNELGYYPQNIAIMFANSPCITNTLLFNAFSFLTENKKIDSVVSAMKRSEFSPARMFTVNGTQLKQDKQYLSFHENIYFLDHRVIVIRTDNILNCNTESNYIESVLGNNIYPVLQQEGIWDIDYIWQIPMIERWLKQNGFNDSETPYDKFENPLSKRFTFQSRNKSGNSNNGTASKVLITTIPFGNINPLPLRLLESTPNLDYVINPIGRKLKEDELAELVTDFDIMIAGTEPITRKVLEHAKKLKLISRVGIGLDNVDLKAARDFDIKVSYTPDAPAPAVAELVIGQMINILRRVPLVDRKLRSGIWQRIHGERLSNMTVGIIGTGRVGSRVLKHLQGFNPKRILVNDLKPDFNLYEMYNAVHVDKETIYKEADLITLHVPLTNLTYNLIAKNEIELMKKNSFLINTSRGGIINENDLYDALSKNRIAAAAVDVFENEPYTGKLIELDNCFLTCHMGSMTNDCRSAMEILATEEAIRFVKNEPLVRTVPEEEYLNAVVS